MGFGDVFGCWFRVRCAVFAWFGAVFWFLGVCGLLLVMWADSWCLSLCGFGLWFGGLVLGWFG